MIVTLDAKRQMKVPIKAKRAPKRDLSAELSEGMTALALLRPERREAGTKVGTTPTVAVTLRAATRG